MNEQELGRKVAQALEAGLDDIPVAARYGLERARAAALARAQDRLLPLQSGPVDALRGILAGRRVLAPALVLVMLLAGVLYWQQAQHVQPFYADSAEMDTALLTDELPVTAYLDQGFEIWLYHQTPAPEQP